MEIFYEGKDITDLVQVRQCLLSETSGGRCDSLKIEFENAAKWYAWGPEEDDQIFVAHGGVTTGVMFLNTVLPEDGKYSIFATSLPCKARAKTWNSFINKSIEEILRACAMASGMDYQIYGIDKGAIIPYAQQENESSAAFLNRLMMWEGAALKCVNGKYTAIGLSWAQQQEAQQTITVMPSQHGISYTRSGKRIRELAVETPFGSAKAVDLLAASTFPSVTVTGIPAGNAIQAGRYARGLLMNENRKCESLTVDSEFNPGFSAMARINIEGGTDATGEWLIEEAQHDLINLTSTARMRRCIQTIQ